MSTDQAMMGMHLRGNFFPPLSLDYVEPALLAVELCRDEDFDAVVILPESIEPVPRLAVRSEEGWAITAGQLVEVLRINWEY